MRKALIETLSPLFLKEIAQADVDINPRIIVRKQIFENFEYEEARQLEQQVQVQTHDFESLGNGKYIFDLLLMNGFLHFEIKITFSTHDILKISVNSMIRNYSTSALKIIGLKKFLHYYIRENPVEETNSSARILLNHFTKADHDLPITLRAQILADGFSASPELSFKLGQDAHLYQIKSLPAFVDSVRENRPLDMGKYFNRTVEIEQMDDSSRAWYELLENIIDSSEAVQKARNAFSAYSFNTIPLTGSVADMVDRLMHNGVTLYDKTRLVHYDERQDKLPLKINFDKKTNKATLYLDYLVPIYDLDGLIRGSRHFYYYKTGTWTCFSKIDPNYLDRYGIEMGGEMTFGHKTIQTLGRKVLPQLNRSGNFALSGYSDLQKALPPKAEFVFKLDFADQNIVCTPTVFYGKQEFQLEEKSDAKIPREMNEEKAAKQTILKLGFVKDVSNKYTLSIGSADKIDYFFDEGINQLKKVVQVKATAAFKRLLGNIKSKFNVSLGIRLSKNTLDLTVAGDQLAPEDIQAILNAYQKKRHYFMLRNGQMHSLESPSLEDLDQIMTNLGLSLKRFVKGKMAIPAYRAFYLEKMLERRGGLTYTSNDQFKKLIADLEKGKAKKETVPASVKTVMRPYQVQGFEWMSGLLDYNLGGLLADEMGLGKTLQTIAILLSRRNKTNLPSIIIVPASVVYNWEAEMKKFAPEIETLVLGGDKKQRWAQLKQVKNQVLITSYDSLKRDLELYENINFDLEVIDEAQNIKNAKAAVSKAVKVINSDHRIALTGTPIENNLSELWSIFDYLMPGFLGEYDYFKNNYEKPIVKENNEKIESTLSQIIAPFVLRRLKKDVLHDLPEKNEHIVYTHLSGKQNDLYQAQVQKLINQLHKQDEKDFKKQRLQVLAEITKLRELCCDPHLLYEDYRGKSAKLAATLELLENSLADGHKVLLFSQFTSMLDIIQKKLQKLGMATYVITGSTPKQKRQALIKEFNQLNSPAVFLISLKAGGTGINLTSADVVIHYDPWWNVAAENQATDRAHRIGQKHNVQIYKMVAKDTIEEKIIELQQNKARLAEEVLSGKEFTSGVLDKDDLLAILER